jgi:hypothetical protein
MKKKKKFALRSTTDLKVFLLFLLENIRYPIDRTTLINIISENTEEIVFDYDASLGELSDLEHIWFDEIDGERYYMISDSGRMVASELCDSLDPEFRERSIKCAAKHMSLAKMGAKIEATVTELQNGQYNVSIRLSDSVGEMLGLSISLTSRHEAEKIRDNFISKPDAVYRGILFSLTGRLEFIS